MRHGFGRGETAVSDVIGTVLLLGITVSLFAVFSIAVLDQFERNPPPPRTEFRVDTLGERTSMTSVWGEPMAIANTRLIYEVDNVRTVQDLAAPSLIVHLTDRQPDSDLDWNVGETLRFACPVGETCAHPGKRVTNVTVVDTPSNSVVFSSQPGVIRGGIVEQKPDLDVIAIIVTNRGYTPESGVYVATPIDASVTIGNVGTTPTPTPTSFTVDLLRNGVWDRTWTVTTVMREGELTTLTYSPSWGAGDHALEARITTGFPELDLVNNNQVRSVTLLGGSHP